MTYHSVDNCVLAEQDNFTRSTDEPLAILSPPLYVHWRFTDSQFLHSFVDHGGDSDEVAVGNCDSAGLKKSVSEVIQKVRWVLNTDTEANQIFG